MGNLKLFFVDFFGTSMEISEQYLKWSQGRFAPRAFWSSWCIA
jgi:hypothetical protein